MVSFKSLSIAALASVATAQTPQSNYTGPTTNTELYVQFQNYSVTPGLLVPRNATANPPNITTSTYVSNTSAYSIIMMIDLDVLRNGSRVPLLHWLAPNVTKVTPSASNSTLNITNPRAAGDRGAPYLQPSPPVGDIAHRYVQFLFAQPANFSTVLASLGNLSDTTNRVNFSYQSLIQRAGLGAPLAANYIRVQQVNTTTNATTTSTTSSSAAAGAGATGSSTSRPAVATATANAAVELAQGFGGYAVAGMAIVGMLL